MGTSKTPAQPGGQNYLYFWVRGSAGGRPLPLRRWLLPGFAIAQGWDAWARRPRASKGIVVTTSNGKGCAPLGFYYSNTMQKHACIACIGLATAGPTRGTRVQTYCNPYIGSQPATQPLIEKTAGTFTQNTRVSRAPRVSPSARATSCVQP